MKKIIITVGISGSGKSTWAKAFCQANPNWLRISRDEIRKSMLSVSLNDYHTWENTAKFKIESLVSSQFNLLIINALKGGFDVVLDNTHLKLSYINEYRKLLAEHFEAFEINYQFFDVALEICLENDKNRADIVGEAVINEQAEKLKILRKLLHFETETHERETHIIVQNQALPACVLVDIDGTVATMHNRYAFDWHKVGEDLPKKNIINLVKTLKDAGKEIIFFSGRDEACRAISRAWICEYFNWKVTDFQLFMRASKDQRKDSIVKFELFENHIKDRYFVDFILDDRQQVVDMWRQKLGLTCLQVDYGDF